MAQKEATGIRVQTKFFWLAFLLYFFNPTIVIDGKAEKVKWGEVFFPTTPGQHTVEIFFRYFFMDAGRASTTVTVEDGKTVFVSYRPPWIVFMPGKITVT